MKKKRRIAVLIFGLMIMLLAAALLSEPSEAEKPILSVKAFAESDIRLGVVQGSPAQDCVENMQTDAQLLYYESLLSAGQALEAGKIDGVACELDMLSDYSQNNKKTAVMKEVLGTAELCACLRSEDKALLEHVNAFISRAAQNGILPEMKERWLIQNKTEMPRLAAPKAPKGILRILSDGSNQPFSYLGPQGRTLGFDAELGARIAYSAGFDYKAVTVDGDSLMEALRAGKGDIILCNQTKMEDTGGEFIYSEPYLEVKVGILVQNSRYAGTYGIAEQLKNEFVKTFVSEGRWRMILEGMAVTLEISVAAFILASALGAWLCRLKRSERAWKKKTACLYIRLMNGIPVLIVLMLLYYVIFKSSDISGVIMAVLAFGMSEGAALAEIFAAGLESVNKGQIDAAVSIGFSPKQVFLKVVLPQAAGNVFSVYRERFVELVKETSVVAYVAVMYLTKVIDIIQSSTYISFIPLAASSVLYFFITYLFTLMLTRVEYRIDPKRRSRIPKGVHIL